MARSDNNQTSLLRRPHRGPQGIRSEVVTKKTALSFIIS